MTWAAVIRWGDRISHVSGVNVTIEQRIDLSARETSYTPQRIELAVLLPYDAAGYMYSGGTVTPQDAAVAIVDADDVAIRTYPVIDIRPGRAGELSLFRIGYSLNRDAAAIPSSVTEIAVRVINVGDTLQSRAVAAENLDTVEGQIAKALRGWNRLGNRYGVMGDQVNAAIVAKLRARREYEIGRLTWTDYDDATEGRTYPIVVGAPGYCDVSIRAIRAALVDQTNQHVMVQGHTSTPGTCTLFGPDPPDVQVVDLYPTGHIEITIPPMEFQVQAPTMTTFTDQAGRVVAGVDVDAWNAAAADADKFAGPLETGGTEWFANYGPATTARGLASDVGAVVSFLLAHAPGIQVDYRRFADLSSLLPVWRLDGVIDQKTSGWDLLTSSILPLLPVHLVDAPGGIRPIYTSTLRGWREAKARLEEGAQFAGLGAPALSAGGGVVNDVSLSYAYDVADREYRRTVRAGALDALHLGTSEGTYGTRPYHLETAWIYDDETAQQIVNEIAHRLHAQLLTLEYLATPELHGPGGALELEIGDIVRITDARYSITDRLAMVTIVSRSPVRLVIGLTVIPSAMPAYVVPGAVSTVFLLAVGDNGSSQAAARTSTGGAVTWAAVSGLPAEGALNACAYDEDSVRYLCVGQTGAAVLVSRDGGTVTDTSPGGTANLYGCTYRGSTETGGALFVLVGNAGRLDHSADGATWTTVTGFGSIGLYLAYYHDDYFYVGGNSGRMWYSANGTSSYTVCDTAGTQRNTDMTWSGTNLVVCRRSGKIAHATPANARGGTWTAATSGVGGHLYAIVSDGAGVVVAVGASGAIIRSADHGATWATKTSGTSEHLQGITYTGSVYIAVGDSGVCLSSPAGTTWTARTSGAPDDLNWVESSGGFP